MRITRYSGGENFSNDVPKTSVWTIEVEDSSGTYHLLGTIEFGFREDEPVEMRSNSGTSSCDDLNGDVLGNRYPFSCSELGIENATPEPEPSDFYDPVTVSLFVDNFATQGATGSDTYVFTEQEVAIEIASSGTLQVMRVGLANTEEGDIHWYVTSSAAGNDGGAYAAGFIECRGQEVWEFGEPEQDHLSHFGCLGEANDIVTSNDPFDFRISPVVPDLWEIEISEAGGDWHKIATLEPHPGQEVDHTQDFLSWTGANPQAIACQPLVETVPKPCPDE
jgi:hypothetical protein